METRRQGYSRPCVFSIQGKVQITVVVGAGHLQFQTALNYFACDSPWSQSVKFLINQSIDFP